MDLIVYDNGGSEPLPNPKPHAWFQSSPCRQIMMDLSGWNVRSMACGPAHFVVAADESVITWGAGTNGELAYGADGKKSSANPAKCQALEGMHVHQVRARDSNGSG